MPTVWPLWGRVLFRFLATYFTLYIAPWATIGSYIPLGPDILVAPWQALVDWMVRQSNAQLFHVTDTLVAPNGSGDTSWAWAQLCLYLLIATVATVIWSVVDHRRLAYERAGYWLRTMLRYELIIAGATYGFIKLFPFQQMPFPTLSQLATPLGDLLPMRFSWLYVGYSAPYQMFCGGAEVLTALLLYFRRTAALGVLFAVGAFANVLIINLAYDVPVKLFATHLFIMALVLATADGRRLFSLFVLNRSVDRTPLFDPPLPTRIPRWGHLAVKIALGIAFLAMPFRSSYQRWQASRAPAPVTRPLAMGMYDVRTFIRNGDTIPALVHDTTRWHDVIIDSPRGGSVGTTDPRFWQRYRRGYFLYAADTSTRILTVWRTSMLRDSVPVFTARYALSADGGAQLWTQFGRDSVHVELVRSTRHFQLSERQFHWLSEYNR